MLLFSSNKGQPAITRDSCVNSPERIPHQPVKEDSSPLDLGALLYMCMCVHGAKCAFSSGRCSLLKA